MGLTCASRVAPAARAEPVAAGEPPAPRPDGLAGPRTLVRPELP